MGGWSVDTVPAGGRRGAGRTYRCRGVIVSAGVLGTLELLMASRDAGHLAQISPMLGRRVRSNSEVIVGVTARDPSVDLSRGLAASSSVWLDQHTQVQADRYPKGSDAMGLLSTLLVDGGGKIPRPLRFIAAAARAPGDFLRSLSPAGFAERTVFLVVMQDQPSSLRMIRVGHGLDTRAEDVPIPTYIPEANDFARRLAGAMNGYARSAVSEVFLNRPVTAHILGGCPIGAGPDEGVVDDRQRVFGYPGLWVADGTVIPVNLGVNPVLTILGFAERAMSFIPTRDGDFKALRAEARWGVSELLVRA
jgi:cholesterol oxidase